MECFALGELGLKRAEFNEMSWEDYCYASHGYFVRQARDREPLRLILSVLYNANVDKKDRCTPEKLMPLMTDYIHKQMVDPEAVKNIKAQQRAKAIQQVEKINARKRAEQFQKTK